MTPAPARPRWETGLLAAALVLAALAAYWPALHGGFIWSDESFLTRNEMMRAPDGLHRFWLTTEPADYWPVTATSFWLEWRLWGAHPFGYHATNLGLHLAGVLLLWAVLRRLKMPGAYVAAFLFAVHPVNVQSVAWIVERKNLLALLFYLLSILAFLGTGFAAGPAPGRGARRWWYAASLAAYGVAMLSKGSVALLPLVLAGLVAARRGLERADAGRLAPFFAVGAFLTGVNVWFQGHHLGGAIRHAGWLERCLGAGAVVWFYLGKALLPLHLAFVYPQWGIRPGEPRWWLPLLGAALLTLGLVRSAGRRWPRAALLAWGYFCVSLVPVMGFSDVYFMKYSLVGDHYQHLALIGVTTFAGWAWAEWRAAAPVKIAAAALAIGACGILTWRQCRLYRDAETLFSDTIERNPGSWMARNNRGIVLAASGRLDAAIGDFEEALRLKPDYADARVNLGDALGEKGRSTEAIGQFEAALRLDPRREEALEGLGITLIAAGRPEEAAVRYRQALALSPGSAPAHHGLGLALALTGRAPEAIAQLAEAVRLDPATLNGRMDLGGALASARRYPEAEAQYRAALRLAPGSAKAGLNLGNVLSHEGRFADAIPCYVGALQAAPASPVLHHNLAVALAAVGRNAEAEAQYGVEAAERAAPAGQP